MRAIPLEPVFAVCFAEGGKGPREVGDPGNVRGTSPRGTPAGEPTGGVAPREGPRRGGRRRGPADLAATRRRRASQRSAADGADADAVRM